MPRPTLPPYAAWLRVYEPLAAFTQTERLHWAGYAADPARPSRVQLLAGEQEAALRRAIALPARVGPDEELRGAFVLDGVGSVGTCVCPLDERLRSWVALESLRTEIPEPLLSAFVPAASMEAALTAYAGWRVGNPVRQPRILTATWHIPLWWFLAFSPDEARLTLGPDPDRGLRYLTSMGKARQRMARALNILQRSMGEGTVTEGVEDVARWLEEFHPHSQVELDYGGLATLVDDDALRADTSVADVGAGLAALAAGEPDGAAAAYARLVERWQDVQALEHAT